MEDKKIRVGKIGEITKKENGLAFVTVIVFVFLSLAALVSLNKRISMILTVSEHETLIEQGQDGKYVALARALTLLQTGTPPESPSAYSIKLIERAGTPEYAVIYEQVGSNSWSVKVAPLTGSLPSLPETFGGS